MVQFQLYANKYIGNTPNPTTQYVGSYADVINKCATNNLSKDKECWLSWREINS